MTLRLPLKLLEITVRSAQDLPPVSRQLRTYAVAWLQPDHKFTTRIDREGNTNPTWNDKFVFKVDQNFLDDQSSSSLTIEIFSLSWLRDIPIGSVQLPINDLIPPNSLSRINLATRFVNLQLSRPSSGHLQGIVNVGINLVDCSELSGSLSPAESDIPTNEKIVEHPYSIGNIRQDNHLSSTESDVPANEKIVEHPYSIDNIRQDNHLSSDSAGTISPIEMYNIIGEPKKEKIVIKKLQRSQSEKTVSFKEASLQRSGSNLFERATNRSMCSSNIMRPLPSEVAAGFTKGMYSTSSRFEVGSSIFDGWTTAGGSMRKEMPKDMVVLAATTTRGNGKRSRQQQHYNHHHHNRNHSNGYPKKGKGLGLFSCFGTVCGYECNVICGSPKSRKKNKKKFGKNYEHVAHAFS